MTDLSAPSKHLDDNPWYLLATLYGQPSGSGDTLAHRNRIAWNRYFAGELTGEFKAWLIQERRHAPGELEPFSEKEREEIARAFSERCGGRDALVLPPKYKVDFSDLEFHRCCFSGYVFPNAVFHTAKFSGVADFSNAIFTGIWGTNFYRTKFADGAQFSSAIILSRVTFLGATFSGMYAEFSDTIFIEAADFQRTTFSGDDLKWVSFKSAKFLGKADFRHAAFSPSDNINFSTTIFEGLPTFDEAKFGTQTSFQEATFLRFPPNFFGATLHEHTVWRGVKHWPIPSPCPRQAGLTRHPMGGAQHARTDVRAALTQRAKKLDQGDHRPVEETPDDPGLFVDCYERLKLEMDRLKKHDDELFFFTQEMRCRRILQGSWSGLPLAIYGALCEYGRSFARPLYWILVTIVLGALAALRPGQIRESPGVEHREYVRSPGTA
jgi:uncharacterized protein YjbI with pentapeptide repeats